MNINTEARSAGKIPKVSVVVPVYNVEKYLRDCLNSVLSQTIKNFEIIVVNDASTDKSAEIAKEYLVDKRVRIIHNKINSGLGITRNNGLDVAEGEYVYFLDSDDAIAPNALETMLKAAEETGADVIHMSENYDARWDSDKQQYVNHLKKEHIKDFPNDILARMEHWVSYLTRPVVWLNLFRKDFLIKNSLRFPDMISEDETFAFAVYCFAKKICKINGIFYIHRMREGSIMNRHSEERLKEGLKGMVVGVRYLDEVMNSCSVFKENMTLRLQMQYFLLSKLITSHISPFYEKPEQDGAKLRILAQETLAPILGEHTTLVNLLLYQLQLHTGNTKKIIKQMEQNQSLIFRGF